MLEKRSSEKEQLDNLELGGKPLHKTLDGLSLINKLFGNTNATFEAIQPTLIGAETSLTVIDLGCGGGDNLRKIAKWCAQKNIRARFIGIDGNQNVLDYALSKNNDTVQVEYVQADILSSDFKLPSCDVLLSSHFIYHFTDDALIAFLRDAKNKVRQSIIFSELERSTAAYRLFSFAAFFMPFSKMIRSDGKRAIKRAFTYNELQRIFERAEIESFTIHKKWAFRLLSQVNKPK